MGVNSLPKTVTRQRRDCDLIPGPSAPESSTLTTRLLSHPTTVYDCKQLYCLVSHVDETQIRFSPLHSSYDSSRLNWIGQISGFLSI